MQERKMKVAVTYDEGEIFQHFGKTPAFLFAEIEGKKIVSQTVEQTGESGHSALFGFLKSRGVDAVVCGGIGQGARDALSSGGISVIAGQSGSAEAALAFFANGDLKDSPAGTCSHHHGGGHQCSHHDDSCSSSTCGSSGCGHN